MIRSMIFSSGAAAAILALTLSGCAPSASRCTPQSVRAGTLCVGGINFGTVTNPVLKAGIRDGCRTGQGEFTKNYRLSRSNPLYQQGWDRGRTLCRPRDWSDSPTYSYHPVTREREEDPSYVPAAERQHRYTLEEKNANARAWARSGRASSDDTPEIFDY